VWAKRRQFTRLALVLAIAICGLMASASAAQALQAVAPDGSVVVARGNVELTVIGPDGVPDGVVHQLNPDPKPPLEGPDQTENSHLVALGVAPSGVITAVWLEIVGWDAEIVTRQAASDGTPLGEPVVLATDQEIHIRPRLGIGPDGTATVVWGRLASPGQEVVAQRIAPDGTPEGGPILVSEPNAKVWRPPALAVAPDGTATVVWAEDDGEDHNLLLERRIAPDGTLEPDVDQLGFSAWGMTEPEVEVAADGTAVVLWEQWEMEADPELWTRRVEPDGDPEASAHLLDGPRFARFVALAVAPDGSAAVTWREEGTLKARLVDSSGVPAAVVTVTSAGDPVDEWAEVFADPDGDFFVSWGEKGCGAGVCLYFGRLSADGTVEDVEQIDSPKTGGRATPLFLADGTTTFVWSRLFAVEPYRLLSLTRQMAPDGDLGPTYDFFLPGPEPVIAADAAAIEFGEVPAGSKAARSLSVRALTIEPLGAFSAALAGADADRFEIAGTTCGPALSHPATCTVEVAFSPNAAGAAEAELVLDAGEGKDPVVVELSGSGTHSVEPAPPTLGTLAPPPARAPSNAVDLGRLELDRRTGTALLPVVVPGPGTVELDGPCLGGADARRAVSVSAAGMVLFTIQARAHCRKQLRRKGSTSFGVSVAFTPTGGHPGIEYRRLTLRLSRATSPTGQ